MSTKPISIDVPRDPAVYSPLELLPQELFTVVAYNLQTVGQVRLCRASRTTLKRMQDIEARYRGEHKERIRKIFSNFRALFTTDLRPVENKILVTLDGMTLKNMVQIKATCEGDLQGVSFPLIEENKSSPAAVQQQQLSMLALFISSRPQAAAFARSRLEICEVLRDSLAQPHRLGPAQLDQFLEQGIFYFVQQCRFDEAELYLVLVKNPLQREKICRKILKILVLKREIKIAARFFNLYPTDALFKDVINFYGCHSDEKLEDVRCFAKESQCEQAFLYQTCHQWIEQGCLEKAESLMSSMPESKEKENLQSTYLAKKCENLAKQGLLNEVLNMFALHPCLKPWKGSAVRWFVQSGFISEAIEVLNTGSVTHAFMLDLINNLESSKYREALALSERIIKSGTREFFSANLSARLADQESKKSG